MPQTVRRFAGNVFGADLVAVQTQHLHPGEVGHVDRTAKAAQGEVCKIQERSECQTLQEKTISESHNYMKPLKTLYDASYLRLVFSEKFEK